MGLNGASTPSQQRRLEALRAAARLLDSALPVPGTSWRIGLDPILGLIPGVGDLVSPLFTVAIVWQARSSGVPKVVLVRMILNVAIDALTGAVPFAGDLFDFAWKANSMNLALLEAHAAGERRSTTGDWVFVGGVILALVTIAVLPLLIVSWIVARLIG